MQGEKSTKSRLFALPHSGSAPESDIPGTLEGEDERQDGTQVSRLKVNRKAEPRSHWSKAENRWFRS